MIFFQKHLLEWYKKYGRHTLPWRKENITPYEVWVSEIMLQQTQVNRVIAYYNRFLEKFPTIESLAATSWEEFLPYYQGLGYYQRGRNMLHTAQIIVEQYNGVFPTEIEELKKLPGIGEYTAAAILSFAHNIPVLSFDTNLQRVFGRYIHGDKKAKLNIKDITEKVQGESKIINGAIMDFANIVCFNKKPQCGICPMRTKCEYVINNRESDTTSLSTNNQFPTQDAQVFLFLHEKHTIYYSSESDRFQPFILKKEYNTRPKIKNYFKKTYDLEISVRPAYKKEYRNGIPTLFINAQILLGTPQFKTFLKNEISFV